MRRAAHRTCFARAASDGGFIPNSQHHFGSSASGGSNTWQYPDAGQQQRHHGDFEPKWRVGPQKDLSQKAAASTVGYGGFKPTDQQSIGVSYWDGRSGPEYC